MWHCNRRQGTYFVTSRPVRSEKGSKDTKYLRQGHNSCRTGLLFPQVAPHEDRDVLERCQLTLRRLRTYLCVEDRAICTPSHSPIHLSLLWSEIRCVNGSVHPTSRVRNNAALYKYNIIMKQIKLQHLFNFPNSQGGFIYSFPGRENLRSGWITRWRR